MLKQTTLLLTTTAVLCFCVAAQADTLNDNKVVYDRNNHVVQSKAFKNCVRTEWEAGSDICAPEPAPAPKKVVKVPAPRTVLETAERTVYFNFDSAGLTGEAQQNLDQVAQKLRAAKDVKHADIVGYADRIGAKSYNVALSRKRAESVKEYLAERGYINTRIAEVRGLGEDNPVKQCDDSLERDQKITCLSPNRRVELEVQYLEQR